MRHQKKFFILVLLSFCLPGVHAQEIEWQKTIGGSGWDELFSINPTADRGFIGGGFSNSSISGTKTENCMGQFDFWVVKQDSIGNIQWQNTIGGSLNDRLVAIEQTSDGGYICGGYSNSNISGDKTDDCRGGLDYWIIKLDVFGNIDWQKTIGGSGADQLTDIHQTSDGGFMCGGFSNSDISGEKSESSLGSDDFWLVKLDSSGNIEWQNTIGGSDLDWLQSIQQTSDGGYICGGKSSSIISGDKTENCRGGLDYWIIKLDVNGNLQWQKAFGGTNDDDLFSIFQTTEGGYFCAGWSGSFITGDKSEVSQGGSDFWVLKLDSSGNILWQNTIGGSLSDWLHASQQTHEGGYIVSGFSYSGISADKTEISNGGLDFWIIKLDSIGMIEWQNTIGGSAYDHLTAMRQMPDGDFICGGWSESGVSGDKTEISQSRDFWILKITGKYNLINGKIFADLNSNTIQDSGEHSMNNYKIAESNTQRIAFSDANGFYSLPVFDSGIYEVSPTSLSYFNLVPAGHPVTFSSYLQTDSLNDFAFQPSGTFNDLCVTITPIGAFRSGMNATYMINYTNHGTTTLSPTVIFYPDVSLNYVSSVPAATTIAPDSIIFTFGPLLPFQSGQILITVIVNSGLPVGTMINSGAAILPVAGDVNPACNTSYIEVLTTGSYDPNDILVNRDSLYTSEIINPEPLEYIIRFQNTGNDTAFYVRIDNKISTNLQLGTIEFVAASHSCSMEYQQYDSTLKFTFNNILLPDSNINEPASHGFVRYKIKPETTLSAGDSIRNSAGIYFDYNAPVWTNTAVTEIVLPTGMDAPIIHDEVQLTVYPNPVLNVMVMEIRNAYHKTLAIDLYNVYGQRVMELHSGLIGAGKSTKSFDLGTLPGGIYVVRAEDAESQSFQISRIVKL